MAGRREVSRSTRTREEKCREATLVMEAKLNEVRWRYGPFMQVPSLDSCHYCNQIHASAERERERDHRINTPSLHFCVWSYKHNSSGKSNVTSLHHTTLLSLPVPDM